MRAPLCQQSIASGAAGSSPPQVCLLQHYCSTMCQSCGVVRVMQLIFTGDCCEPKAGTYMKTPVPYDPLMELHQLLRLCTSSTALCGMQTAAQPQCPGAPTSGTASAVNASPGACRRWTAAAALVEARARKSYRSSSAPSQRVHWKRRKNVVLQ